MRAAVDNAVDGWGYLCGIVDETGVGGGTVCKPGDSGTQADRSLSRPSVPRSTIHRTEEDNETFPRE